MTRADIILGGSILFLLSVAFVAFRIRRRRDR
jgi:hypothetical protein